MKFSILKVVRFAVILAATHAALASTWYVNGLSGKDSNNCTSPPTACKTIKHAISFAASGDSIIVAAATYTENLTISKDLNILGSGAPTTIIDGGGIATVVTISSATTATLSGVTIRNGSATQGGGIYNSGTLMVNTSILSGNRTSGHLSALGGGIYNAAVLTINKSTISGNTAGVPCPSHLYGCSAAGGGIYNSNLGTLTISSSTLVGNSAGAGCDPAPCGAASADGGGISNAGKMIVSNSTLVDNSASGRSYLFPIGVGGSISNAGAETISNTTVSGSRAVRGGGISGTATIQNSIVANNTSGGNCYGTVTSKGYNLSSDGTCNFNGAGDMNNTKPMLGTLGNYGGPTQTIPLLSGSPAIDAGDPSGCKDSQGNLLKTDQRGMPRPDKEDAGGCDIGAFERQSD